MFEKFLAKSIGFMLGLYLAKTGSKSCHYNFGRHHNSCLFHTEPAFENQQFTGALELIKIELKVEREYWSIGQKRG